MSEHISSAGERAAIVGYSAQYQIAAELIYNALLSGNLEKIAVADPEAGRLDDIQIITQNRVDAYQVKWGVQPSSSSFNDLSTGKGDPDGSNSGLIGQLAGGWKRLKSIHPDKKIIVHLVTRDFCSPDANIPHSAGTTSKANLYGFITDCWLDRTWCNDGFSRVPTGWKPAFEALKNASALDDDFFDFITASELHYSYQLEEISKQTLSRTEDRRKLDIDTLSAFLFKLVGAEKRQIHLTKQELLHSLSWLDRFKFRSQHEFPIEKCYQPITETVNAIELALESCKQGYLALIGTPGSGKSTTLTHTLRYKKNIRLIRYYAFVPDHPSQARGESSNFLHDLVLALQQYCSPIKGSQPATREELLERLSNQLESLNQKWLENETKTIIMIDGLDHIRREQRPIRSLLLDLPLVESIPEGVIFILGSQTLDLNNELSASIKSQLTQDNRTIIMKPLSKGAVFSIINNMDLGDKLSTSSQDKVFHISEGHPLALIYLIQKIKTLNSTEDIETTLNESIPYEGNIERLYDAYWESIRTNESLQELLALLCRLRIGFDQENLKRLASKAVLRNFLSDAKHFFRVETNHQWRFFHNSFRQYLIKKTSTDIFGSYDKEVDKDYHKKLAELCLNIDGILKWQTIYHLSQSEQWSEILSLGKQQYFRQQFFDLRSMNQITEDISLVLDAAYEEKEGFALFRMVLIEHELKERYSVLEQSDISQMLFSLDPEFGYQYADNKLKIPRTEILLLCEKFIKSKNITLARELFNISEPLEFISGTRKITKDEEIEDFFAWLRCSIFFKPLNEIWDLIENLQLKSAQDENIHPNQAIIIKAKKELIVSVLESQISSDIQKLRDLILNDRNAKNLSVFFDFQTCHLLHDSDYAKEALDRILVWIEGQELTDSKKIDIANFYLKIKKDKNLAKQWIMDVKQPDVYKWSLTNSKGDLSAFIKRIRLNRIIAALGEDINPVLVVPNAEDSRNQLYTLFERNLVTIASVWGKSYRAETFTPSSLLRELYIPIRFFQRKTQLNDHSTSWYQLGTFSDDYFRFIINACAAHGIPTLKALGEEFEQLWSNKENSRSWSSDRKRKIAMELYELGDDKSRLIKCLLEVEQSIGVLDDVHERVNQLIQLALSWQEIGEREHALRLLPRVMQGTFSIYHDKDRQIQRWVDFLTKAYQAGVNSCVKDLSSFTSALLILDQSGRGRGTHEAAVELIKIAIQMEPSLGLKIFSYLIRKGGLHFDDGIAGLLLGLVSIESPQIEILLILLRNIYLPLTSNVNVDLVEQIAFSATKNMDGNQLSIAITELTETIKIKAWPSERDNWFNALKKGLVKGGANIEYLGVTPEKPVDKYNSSSSSENTLKLKDGSEITKDQARAMVGNTGDLKLLAAQVVEAKYFSWEYIIEPIINRLQTDQIDDILKFFKDFDQTHKAKDLLANRLLTLGEKNRAIEVLESNILLSQPLGWDRWWDGGSRQIAYKKLIQIDPKTWKLKAFHALIKDYKSEFRYTFNFLENFEELAEIVFDNIPWDELWPEIREHIFQLTEFSFTDNEDILSTEKIISSNEIIKEIIDLSLKLPISEVREYAINTLIEVSSNAQNDNLSKHLILDYLHSSDWKINAHILAYLDMIRELRADFCLEFKQEIEPFLISSNYIIRRMALDLTNNLGIYTNHHSDKLNKELPLLYQMELPKLASRENAIPHGSIRAGETFPDISDPIEMIRPHHEILDILSDFTGIEFENLLERTVWFMNNLHLHSDWNRSHEEKMRQWLENIGLKLTYNRSKPLAALEAIAHVISELIDSDLIENDEINFIYNFIYVYDPTLSEIKPTIKPMEIINPEKDANKYWFDKDWVYNIDINSQVFITTYNDSFTVIGEETTFRKCDNQESPKETRFSLLCTANYIKDIISTHDSSDQYFDPFPSSLLWKARKYPVTERSGAFQSLIISGSPRQVLIGTKSWIALNPFIGQECKWQVSEEGLFRWVDDTGEVMVESIFWQDGSIRRWAYHDEFTAEGWLVIASKEAIKIISKKFDHLVFLQAIKRSIKEDHHDGNHFFSIVKDSELGKV